ncbi:MAG: helix-turn-helix domain-containing protein [Proteobacteria bacterium]|nr:helix-turn-helix domain-containing protein [Pseudomonadota bacterium]MBU4010730.1 helix-turn-helix domain-containing protein [Pseudomonadota bacterium]
MSSMISLPRKKFSYNNAKLYKSLGSLIKEYRQWREINQETFAESIRISVRELQNWEANRRRVRIENLHDISEFTGIPMQALVALNADQPVWYSLRKRLVAYSSMEEAQFSSHELFRPSEKAEDHTLLKKVTITTEKHMDMILSCHRDLYCTKRPLRKDVIRTATGILPNVNIIIFDSWGHYVAHRICLPITIDVYQAMKKQKTLEDYLASEMITDIIAKGEGVFFNYSTFAANISASYKLTLDGIRALSKLKRKEKYLIAGHTVTKESAIIQNNLNMNFVRDYAHMHDEVCPVIYETTVDFQLRLDGPFGWMIDQDAKKALTKNLTKESQQKRLPTNSTQNRNKFSHHDESLQQSNILQNKFPVIVDNYPVIAGRINRDRQHDESQLIKSKIEVCTNTECAFYGKMNKGNIVSNGTYRTKEGSPGRRFLCKKCGKSFCKRTETIFYDLRSPEEKVFNAIKLLAKGLPVQRVAKLLEVKSDTIRHWLKLAAAHSEKLDTILIKEHDISRSDLDILWSFVKTNTLRQRALLCKNKTQFQTVD